MVLAVRREWRGAVELDVTTGEGTIRALAYPELTGRPEGGDRVLLNTSALALGLGTGGYALVVAQPNLPSLEALTDYRPKVPLRIYTADHVLIIDTDGSNSITAADFRIHLGNTVNSVTYIATLGQFDFN